MDYHIKSHVDKSSFFLHISMAEDIKYLPVFFYGEALINKLCHVIANPRSYTL